MEELVAQAQGTPGPRQMEFSPASQAEFVICDYTIEVLFAALKSRGFNFEETHLSDHERIKKLVALLALAFTWAHLVGLWLAQVKALEIKKHGRLARSLFRSGLDQLQYVLLNLEHQRAAFAECVWLLMAPLIEPATLDRTSA